MSASKQSAPSSGFDTVKVQVNRNVRCAFNWRTFEIKKIIFGTPETVLGPVGSYMSIPIKYDYSLIPGVTDIKPFDLELPDDMFSPYGISMFYEKDDRTKKFKLDEDGNKIPNYTLNMPLLPGTSEHIRIYDIFHELYVKLAIFFFNPANATLCGYNTVFALPGIEPGTKEEDIDFEALKSRITPRSAIALLSYPLKYKKFKNSTAFDFNSNPNLVGKVKVPKIKITKKKDEEDDGQNRTPMRSLFTTKGNPKAIPPVDPRPIKVDVLTRASFKHATLLQCRSVYVGGAGPQASFQKVVESSIVHNLTMRDNSLRRADALDRMAVIEDTDSNDMDEVIAAIASSLSMTGGITESIEDEDHPKEKTIPVSSSSSSSSSSTQSQITYQQPPQSTHYQPPQSQHQMVYQQAAPSQPTYYQAAPQPVYYTQAQPPTPQGFPVPPEISMPGMFVPTTQIHTFE